MGIELEEEKKGVEPLVREKIQECRETIEEIKREIEDKAREEVRNKERMNAELNNSNKRLTDEMENLRQ